MSLEEYQRRMIEIAAMYDGEIEFFNSIQQQYIDTIKNQWDADAKKQVVFVDENTGYFHSPPRSTGTFWLDEYEYLPQLLELIEEPSDKASVNKRKVKERLNLNPRTRKQARWS